MNEQLVKDIIQQISSAYDTADVYEISGSNIVLGGKEQYSISFLVRHPAGVSTRLHISDETAWELVNSFWKRFAQVYPYAELKKWLETLAAHLERVEQSRQEFRDQ